MTLLDCKQGFDRCTFPAIFSKVRLKLPAIVTRCLIYIYRNQTAWTRWGSAVSSPFRMTNSTRQGIVLSPTIWNIYIGELIAELRKQMVGCTVANIYMGVIVYADDIALWAPSRKAHRESRPI